MVLGGTASKRLPASLSAHAIKQAWRDSRDDKSKHGAPGIDGVSAPRFASDLEGQIERIRDEIRNGTYCYSRLRLARVPKDSGAYRILAIPTVRDRLLQRSVLRHLEADSRFEASSSISYGFTKKRTLADAQRAALNLRQSKSWVLKCDIVRFFDRIPRDHVKGLIRRRVGRKLIASLLCQAVDCELKINTAEDAEFVEQNGILKGIGLRQGMPVSPLLSNLLLKQFDNNLEKQNLAAVRYADDIIVFTNNRDECLVALNIIEMALADLHLRVPELSIDGKTRIVAPSEVVEFLGVEIFRKGDRYALRAPFGKLNKIEDEMRKMVQITECVAQRRNIIQVGKALDSYVIGHAASMAVLDDGGHFLCRLEAAKRRQLRALLIALLGEQAVAGLDSEQLAVLGVEPF